MHKHDLYDKNIAYTNLGSEKVATLLAQSITETETPLNLNRLYSRSSFSDIVLYKSQFS